MPSLKHAFRLGIFCMAFCVIAFSLVACGESSTAPLTVASAPLKIAVILSGPANDGSWNSLGFEGVVQLRRDYGVIVDYAENMDNEQKSEAAMRDYAAKGYTLIIAHGSGEGFDTAIQKVAPDFPKTWFVQYDGSIAGPNYASIDLKVEEGSYLAGMVAAKTSTHSTFGFVGGVKVDSEVATAQGFTQGVLAVNPTAHVFITYTGDWADPKLAIQAATPMFDQGADVVFYDVDLPDDSLIKLAQDHGKQVINTSFDLHKVAPETVLTSFVFNAPDTFSKIAELWKEGKLEGKAYRSGLKEDAIGIAPLRGKLSQNDEAAITKAKADIIAGTVIVKTSP